MMENSGISMRTNTLLILCMAVLAGCGGMSERTDYKSDAAKVAALEVPPDLVLPKTDDHYTIPEGGGAKAENYSEYARNGAACSCKESAAVPSANGSQPKPPQAVAAATVPPKLQDMAGGGKSILVSEPFDRCWLTVGQALDSARIAVDDKDRSKGLLFLKGGHNQVTVRAVAAGCEVAVNDGSGKVSDETKRITDALYKNLGK
jgi:outer membrane protein assembly factor BamC